MIFLIRVESNMPDANETDYKKKAGAITDTLNELVRSINVFSQSYFSSDLIAQKIFAEGIRFGVNQSQFEIPKAETPLDVCMIYIDILNQVGLMASKQFELVESKNRISCKINPPCMYSAACKHTKDEGITPTCIRGMVFHVFIRDSTGKNYQIKVTEFNPDEGCLIAIKPVLGEKIEKG